MHLDCTSAEWTIETILSHCLSAPKCHSRDLESFQYIKSSYIWVAQQFLFDECAAKGSIVDMYYHCNQCWTVYVCSWLSWMSNEQSADYSALEIHARTLAHNSRFYCVFMYKIILQLRILNRAIKNRERKNQHCRSQKLRQSNRCYREYY